MLINFKVSNSRSIGQEIDLSVLATDDQTLSSQTIDLANYGVKILKTIALFGANSSGKSNILKALLDAKQMICEPELDERQIYFPYNRNHSKNTQQAISYKFVFLIADVLYQYQFSHTSERILEERLTNEKEEKLIFSRKFDKKKHQYFWQPVPFFENSNIKFFQFSTPENRLFLSIANNPVNSDLVKKDEILAQIYTWFKEQLVIFLINELNFNYLISFLLKSEQNKLLILELCQRANIDIKNIEIVKTQKQKNIEVSHRKAISYQYINPESREEMSVFIKTFHQTHNKKGLPELSIFDFFQEESLGTQQFLAWLGQWLYALQKDEKPKVFVIDELGTSLHPKLTMALMKLFADSKTNPYQSQVIFTTHEVKIMDKSVMRPDQIYLVNKNADGNTNIERASDYQTDQYARLDTLYMNGGMSGIPLIQF